MNPNRDESQPNDLQQTPNDQNPDSMSSNEMSPTPAPEQEPSTDPNVGSSTAPQDDVALQSSPNTDDSHQGIVNPEPQGAAAVVPATPSHTKKKKYIVLGVVIAVLVALLGTAAFAYTRYQDPNRAAQDALLLSLSDDGYSQTTGEMLFSAEGSSVEEFSVDGSFDARLADNRGAIDMKARITAEDMLEAPLDLDGSMIVKVEDDATQARVRVNNLDAIVEELLKTPLGEFYAQFLPQETIDQMVATVDGKWIDVPEDETDGASDTTRCSDVFYETIRDDAESRDAFEAAVRDHSPFIVADVLPEESINGVDSFHYELEVTQESALGFVNEIVKMPAFQEFDDCDTEADLEQDLRDLITDGVDDSDIDSSDYSLELWVAKWTHKPTKLSLNAVEVKDNETSTIEFTALTDMDARPVVELPEAETTFDEIEQQITDILENSMLTGPALSDDSESELLQSSVQGWSSFRQ